MRTFATCAQAFLTCACLAASGCDFGSETGSPSPADGPASEAPPTRPLGTPREGEPSSAPVLTDLNAKGRLFDPGADASQAPQIEYKPLRDAKGRVSAYLPLPLDWKLESAPGAKHTIRAPGGVLVNPTETADYAYSTDRFVLQSISQTGKSVSPVLSLDQIVDQGLSPAAREEGYALVKRYPLPALQAFWEAFSKAMPNTGSRREYSLMGTDWKNAAGKHSMIVVLRMVIRNSSMVLWSVSTTELEAPAERFEAAKGTYLAGLGGMRMDEAWQRSMGMSLVNSIRRERLESEALLRSSAAAHRQRMADIDAAGRAARANGQTSSDILDQSHAGYRSRNAAKDAGHSSSVRAVHERTLVTHPDTGKEFQVQSGFKFYWGDGRGGYFGTNDPNYDPRTDAAMEEREWTQFKTQR